MKYIIFFPLLSIFLSCSSIRYVSDFLEEESCPIVTTYNIEGECQKGINRIQEIRVSNAIHSNFKSRGGIRSENPDVIIQFFIKEVPKSYLIQECDYYGRWLYGDHCSTKVVNYVEGSIIIDVIDSHTQAIVWHGAIFGPKFDNVDQPQKKITQYVDKLLANYFSMTRR